STILARSTSRYGDVYLRALDSSSRRCSPDSLIVYRLSLGILSTTSAAGSVAERSPKSTVRIRHRICDRLYLAALWIPLSTRCDWPSPRRWGDGVGGGHPGGGRGRPRAKLRALQRDAGSGVDRAGVAGDGHRDAPPAQAARGVRRVAHHRDGVAARPLDPRSRAPSRPRPADPHGARHGERGRHRASPRPPRPRAARHSSRRRRRSGAPAAAAAVRWRGLTVYGVDGTTLRAPDTAENEAAFGRVPTRWESTGGYPVLRVVALMVLRQHVLTALALGAYRDSEIGLAA